ncbi:MAG: hypothetical protein WBP81_17530 [Solirubrobacteraceae bacterium]
MRVDVDQTAGVPTAAREMTPPIARVRRRLPLDSFELAVLAVLAAVSLWVLALDLWQVIVHGRTWTGTDGVYIVDQMQYLAWIRDASNHVLVSNLFVLHPSSADYFQPAVAISAGLTALGLAPWLSLLLWKPVAVGAIFYVARSYVYRSFDGLWARRSALVLALFFGSFTVVGGSWSVLGDLFPGFLSWGYVFALLGLAAMAGAVLVYDRAWSERRISWWPGLIGALASLMHPWNGELVIAVVLGTELLIRVAPLGGSSPRVGLLHPPRRLSLPAVTVILTGLPLLYYAVLGKTDLSWQLARGASKHSFPLWSIMLAIAPLVVPALLAYRERPQTFLAAATRFWPVGAIVIYVLSASAVGATPLHAFQGITIPLSILAVQGAQAAGWRRLPHSRLLAALALAVFTVPTTLYELKIARQLASPRAGNANFITEDELRALDYLAGDREGGGVLTQPYLGAVVPGKTGRHTYVGDCLWSEPDCVGRTNSTRNLFNGAMSPHVARSFVVGSSARFLLADCQSKADLVRLLGPTITSVRRFGCAAVYRVK